MNIDARRVLPEDVLDELASPPSERLEKELRPIGDPEVIRVQKFLIRKLVERLEQERRNN